MAGGQIDGLMSNLNTSEIIRSIMEYERITVKRMEAQKLVKTKQMSVLGSINAKVMAFKTKAAQLKNTAAFNSAKATVSDEDYLSAVISGPISAGEYSIAIQQLASSHQVASQGFESKSSSLGTGSFSIQVGSGSTVDITLDENNSTLEGLKDAINDSDAGVTAAIVNDGSESNPYRLLLTSKTSGSEGEVTVSSGLSGGTAPDFVNSSFDAAEVLKFDSGSSASVSLGTDASYTGNTNKTYTFTVQGSGAQTIGTDEITINWSDGTNSGSIVVPSDYTEGTSIALTSDGADGLTISLSDGVLTAGDKFQVQAFAPTLQAAQDAVVSLGSSDNGGSPIVVTSTNNTVEDLIPGVTLNLKKLTEAGQTVKIKTAVNIEDIKSKINGFIASYNDVVAELEKQFEYNQDTGESGILFGDTTLITMQSRLRSSLMTKMEGIEGEITLLSQLGIRHNSDGKLQTKDPSALSEALNDNLNDVIEFFTNSGSSTNGKISYKSSSSRTEFPDDGFNVEITQAATRGYLKGTAISDPSVTPLNINVDNYKLKFRIDGLVSNEITLTQKTYNSFDELVNELQSKIDQDEKLAGKDITVSYEDVGDVGYLKIQSSSYGSSSKVEIQAGVDNSAFNDLGLAQGEVVLGKDVKGIINGEEVEGTGQLLTGDEDAADAEGLSLLVELTSDDIQSGNNQAVINVIEGFATRMDDLLDLYTATGEGVLDNRSRALQLQVDNIDSSIEREEERLKIREASLRKQYLALEESLAQWNSTGQFLESNLAAVNRNWKIGGLND